MPLPPRPEPLAGVPTLVVHPDHGPDGAPVSAHGGAPPPIALWFHGFRADAAANAAELERIAAAGFVAVGVDAAGHGARRDPGLEARLAASSGGALPMMLDLAERTAAEVPAIVSAVGERGWGDARRTSLVGVSMGGYLAYRAALMVPDLRAVVAILGSPEWPGDDSPHRRPTAFHDVALLSITAERDENVPPDAARRFHAALAAGHPTPARARHEEIADAPHLMSAEQWDDAMRRMVAWLVEHGR